MVTSLPSSSRFPGQRSQARSERGAADSLASRLPLFALKTRVVQYSQIDSIGVSGDEKGLHWYQWKSTLFQWFYW